ncbi:MAG: tandem-95 repeat protein [Planctomycetota bacterium]|nr:tandem-95 repeat protein [Planctomycetota bacterium]
MLRRGPSQFTPWLALMLAASSAWAESYTWHLRDVSGARSYWRCAAYSNDGGKAFLGGRFDCVYTSTDGGSSYTQRFPAGPGVRTSALSWYSVASSSDGTRAITCADADYVYTSSDGGATWTQRQPAGATAKAWRSVAISSDGTKMAACASGDYVYYSSDSGANWTKLQPAGATTKTWLGVALSSDGTAIAAAADNDYIYTSTDSGSGWTKREPAGTGVARRWFSVALSSDGSKISGAAYGNYVYTSADGGGTWSARTPAGSGVTKNWYSISSSSDGTKIAVCADSDYVYTSSDGGASWTKREPAGAGVAKVWHCVAYAPNGSKLVTSVDGGYGSNVYQSTDDGATWTLVQPPNIYMRVNAIGLSGNGSKAVASLEQNGHPVYTSTDGGATWTICEPASPSTNLAWRGAAVSSDGTRMAVAASGNYVYTSTDNGANWTKCQPAGTGVTKSWRSVSYSSNGSMLAAAAQSDYIYTSTDNGSTWTKREPAGAGVTKSWQSVSVSSDGSKMVASAVNDYVYTSTDSGATWTQRTPAGAGNTRYFYAVSISSDGASMAAAADNSAGTGDYVYVSSDSGATWTACSPAGTGNPKEFLGVSMSADGTHIAAAAWGDYAYTSPDGGATWTKHEVAGPGAAEKMYGVCYAGDGKSLGLAAQHIYMASRDADPPVVTVSNVAQTYVEDGPATAVDPGLALGSAETGVLLKKATAKIAGNFESGSDRLALSDANFDAAYASGTLTITPKAPAVEHSLATYQAALRAVTFDVTSNTPSTAQRTIEFQVTTSGDVVSNVGSQPLNVQAHNDAPVASDQAVNATEDTAKPITLVASDPENDPLTYSIVTGPTHGSLSGTGANLTYTPDHDYFGSDSFTFKVNDGTVDSNVATVTISIASQNDPPVASDQNVTTAANTAKAIVLAASDPENDALTYGIVDAPTHGSLSGTGANRTYTPDANYSGPDSFTFKANDGSADSNVATVSITVTPPNAPPAVAITSPADNAVFTAGSDVAIAASATDSDGSVAKVEFYEGAHKLGEDTAAPFAFTWTTPPAGAYTLTAVATDNLGAQTVSAGVAIVVNAKPLAAISAAPTSGVAPLTVSFSASGSSDPDGSIVSYAWDFGDGQTATGVTATHVYAASGTFTATLTVVDNRAASSYETVAISVQPAPVLGAPTNLRVAARQGSYALSWVDGSAGEQGFYIERRVGTQPWARIATAGPNATSYVDAFPPSGAIYRVQAFKGAQVSAYSNSAQVQTMTTYRDPNLRW